MADQAHTTTDAPADDALGTSILQIALERLASEANRGGPKARRRMLKLLGRLEAFGERTQNEAADRHNVYLLSRRMTGPAMDVARQRQLLAGQALATAANKAAQKIGSFQ